MGATRQCRYCDTPIRLVPVVGRGFLWVHVASRGSGLRCRITRRIFGERTMAARQPMLPGMEVEWRKARDSNAHSPFDETSG